MGWMLKETPKINENTEKKAIPSGVWEKCPKCAEIMLCSDLEENLMVCVKCDYHHRLPAIERVELLIDVNTFYEWDHDIASTDPLSFSDGQAYTNKLERQILRTKRYDAIITGIGLLQQRPIGLGVFDFSWMGGSMGSVVGERIYRLFTRCTELKIPAIIVSCSGGARMHEGLLSLMQMAKTSAAIARFKRAGFPYISVLTDPTTGGVAASFAMLGDLNIAEPKATIGFAGRRVIEGTIGQKLPEDFQTAEFCLEHGSIDAIVKRSELKRFLFRALDFLQPF